MSLFNWKKYRNEKITTYDVISKVSDGTNQEELITSLFYIKASPIPICDLIFTSYTKRGAEYQKINKNLASNKDLLEKIQILIGKCVKGELARVTSDVGLLYLPIFSHAIDMSKIGIKSISRVYHNRDDFLRLGTITKKELWPFVRFVMEECLSSIVSSEEIKKFLEKKGNFIEKLLPKCLAGVTLFDENTMGFEVFQITELVRSINKEGGERNHSHTRFHTMVNKSVTKFLTMFAVHVIRFHCKVTFNKKENIVVFYSREMYQKATEEQLEAWNWHSFNPDTTMEVSPLKEVKRQLEENEIEQPKAVKRPLEENDDDDDIEIIEPPPKKYEVITLDDDGEDRTEETVVAGCSESVILLTDQPDVENNEKGAENPELSENSVENEEKGCQMKMLFKNDEEKEQILRIVLKSSKKPFPEDEMIRSLEEVINIPMKLKLLIRESIVQSYTNRLQQQNIVEFIKVLIKENGI